MFYVHNRFSPKNWENAILNTIKEKPIKQIGFLPWRMGECIGKGADGIVYNYGKNKVIKFIRPRQATAFPCSPQILNFLKQNKKPFIAKIDRTGYFFIHRQKINYYIMEKLYNHVNNRELQALEEKLYKFCSTYGLAYDDVHDGNAMTDEYGKSKVIDLNSFYINNYRKFKLATGDLIC